MVNGYVLFVWLNKIPNQPQCYFWMEMCHLDVKYNWKCTADAIIKWKLSVSTGHTVRITIASKEMSDAHQIWFKLF